MTNTYVNSDFFGGMQHDVTFGVPHFFNRPFSAQKRSFPVTEWKDSKLGCYILVFEHTASGYRYERCYNEGVLGDRVFARSARVLVGIDQDGPREKLTSIACPNSLPGRVGQKRDGQH
jgi:hypothetical protein